MAWARTVWTDLIGTHAAPANVNAGASDDGTIDCNGANKYLFLQIRVQVTFGGTPDGDCDVELFDHDLDDQAQDATFADTALDIPESAGVEEILPISFNCTMKDGLTVKVTNNDSADAVTVWVKYMATYQS